METPDEPSEGRKDKDSNKGNIRLYCIVKERLPLLVQENLIRWESFENGLAHSPGKGEAVIVERMEKQLEFFKEFDVGWV